MAQAASGNGKDDPEPIPLTGQVLITSEAGDPGTSVVDGTCNQPFGQSEFAFEVTGVAVGPYPGTFREEGTFTLGPVGFPLVAFEAEFTITSPAGTVTGTKALEGITPTNVGTCGDFVFAGADSEAVNLQAPVRYTATITTPHGTANDEGESFVTYGDIQLRGDAANGNGFAFDESFASTSFVDDDDHHDDDDD